jgi:hypothetical protein
MLLFEPSNYTSKRDAKLAERQKELDKATEALALVPVHPDDETILRTPAYEIAEKVAGKEWTCLAVVAAFARQCIDVQKDTNCLTEGTTSDGD